MFQLFKKVVVHVKFYPNEIEVVRLDTKASLKRTSVNKFSTDRMVIADFNNAERHFTGLVKELMDGKRSVTTRLVMIMQQMVSYPDGLSEVEKRAMRDLAEHAGAVEVHILDNDKAAGKESLLEIISTK